MHDVSLALSAFEGKQRELWFYEKIGIQLAKNLVVNEFTIIAIIIYVRIFEERKFHKSNFSISSFSQCVQAKSFINH